MSILRLNILGGLVFLFNCVSSQAQEKTPPSPSRPTAPDGVQQAQSTSGVERTRPEQKRTEHDQQDVFKADAAPASSPALKAQPDEGTVRCFDGMVFAVQRTHGICGGGSMPPTPPCRRGNSILSISGLVVASNALRYPMCKGLLMLKGWYPRPARPL